MELAIIIIGVLLLVLNVALLLKKGKTDNFGNLVVKNINDLGQNVTLSLEKVYKGFGELNALTSGVNDIKKVLSNVKTRGTWGEVQLGNLLSQMLSPNQFVSNVVTKPGTMDRVEFAVVMPGKNNQNILLPIDAKFPIEDYSRIVDASERGDTEALEENSKRLEQRIMMEAKKISEKYICVPQTTDFAIMYLPIEGLYAEVLRRGSLVSDLQTKHKVLVCSPTTLCALINSLQMGFKTLAIEKRTSEVWRMLNLFKQEFTTYCAYLDKTQKKLQEANNVLDFAVKKTKTIERKLSQVQSIDGASQELLVDFKDDEQDTNLEDIG